MSGPPRMSNLNEKLTIRTAGAGDFDSLRDLYRHLVTDDLPATEAEERATYDKMLRQPGLKIFLAKHGALPVASCVLAVIPNMTRGCAPYALIENVITHGAWRGQGIGRKLMQTAIDSAFGEGCFKIMLLSGAANTRAHRFYEGLGFTTTKTGFELRAAGYPARNIGEHLPTK